MIGFLEKNEDDDDARSSAFIKIGIGCAVSPNIEFYDYCSWKRLGAGDMFSASVVITHYL
jgi:hypothetical protein